MNKLLFLLCCFIAIGAYAQRDKQTPAITLMEVKTDRAAVLKDNGANGFYADIRDSIGALLFEYNFTAAQNDGIADDEYKEIIGFTVIPDRTGKFELKGDALKASAGYLFKGCFCIDRGTFAITGGTIKGTKMSKTTWYINANVTITIKQGENTTTVTKKIKGIFKIVPAP
jgi:hypothetical protein